MCALWTSVNERPFVHINIKENDFFTLLYFSVCFRMSFTVQFFTHLRSASDKTRFARPPSQLCSCAFVVVIKNYEFRHLPTPHANESDILEILRWSIFFDKIPSHTTNGVQCVHVRHSCCSNFEFENVWLQSGDLKLIIDIHTWWREWVFFPFFQWMLIFLV